MKRSKPIVICLGNPLFTDEGLGIHAYRVIAESPLAGSIELIDGGTDGLILLEAVERAEKLLIMDAVDAGKEPGTLVVLKDDEIPLLNQPKLSPHQSSFQEVLALAKFRERYPKTIKLYGIQPHSLGWGLELSPVVTKTLPEMIVRVESQIRNWLIEP